MKQYVLTIALAALLPLAVHARDYDTSNLPYSDSPRDPATAVALSVLTEEGILQGNPDGTFRPEALINRAEFLKVVMGFLPEGNNALDLSCFSDIDPEAWYATPVCRAKSLGIVRGNAQIGLDATQWLFVPERSVNYAEALKMLIEIFDVQTALQGEEWYTPYFDAAYALNTVLPEGRGPGYMLTRGDMARLTVRFLANRDGEFKKLFAAEELQAETARGFSIPEEMFPDDEPEEEIVVEELIEEVIEEVFEEEAEEVAEEESDPEEEEDDAVYDEGTDVSTRSNFLLLGETSSVIGGAEIFSEAQPLHVTELIVRLTAPVNSVSSMSIYDQYGKFLGNAHRDSSFPGDRQYVLPLQTGELTVEQQEGFSFYARANIKAHDAGGTSGEVLQVEKMGAEGDGAYNNKTQFAFSSKTYNTFQTSRAIITKIDNPSSAMNVLIAGQQVRLGSFRFAGRPSSSGGKTDLEVTDLEITVGQVGGLTIDNVRLGADGTSEKMNCASVPGTITCSSIDPKFGSFEDVPRIITIYGDVTIPSGVLNPRLQLSLNTPGDVLSAGSVRWTDGSSNFHWVPGDYPVAQGTMYE